MSSLRRVDTARWSFNFEALKMLKDLPTGHDNVAAKRPGLGTWVKNQRASFRAGKRNSWRIQMLNSIGFVWRVTGEACNPHQFCADDTDTERGDAKHKKLPRAVRRPSRLRRRSKKDGPNDEETAFVAYGYDEDYEEDEDSDDDDDEEESGFPWWSPDETLICSASNDSSEASSTGSSLQQQQQQQQQQPTQQAGPDVQVLKDENSNQKQAIRSLMEENAMLRRWRERRPPRPKRAGIQNELATLRSEVEALSARQSKLVALRGDLEALSSHEGSKIHDELGKQAKIEKMRAELKSLL